MQVSTGGRSGAGHERGAMLSLKPDMASLATGSVNFPTRVYDNSPQLVDWLAQEMLTYGVKPEVEAFEFYVRTLERLAPDSTWTGAGIGKDQITLARWSLELGGHCRTELEDNVRLDRQRLAPSKAALVRQVVELCAEYGRRAATPAEARALLGLTSLTEESTWK